MRVCVCCWMITRTLTQKKEHEWLLVGVASF